jgi:hypothetical protein
MDGYVDVATRIGEFRKKHPAGSLQPADLTRPYTVERIGDQIYIVVVAAAYRDAEDAKPGIGMAYEPFPGRTPYTRGSELQNAETSAWGRAVVAALAADTRKGVSSAEEVRNRRADDEVIEEQRAAVPEPTLEDRVKSLRGQCIVMWKNRGGTPVQLADDYAQWSSTPEELKGRDFNVETDPNLLYQYQRHLQKHGAA